MGVTDVASMSCEMPYLTTSHDMRFCFLFVGAMLIQATLATGGVHIFTEPKPMSYR